MIATTLWRAKTKAAGLHLLLSLLVAGLVAALVFSLWFPYPFGQLSDGTKLFLMVLGVDICCGPLLTLVLFNPGKSAVEWRLDLSLVLLVQLAALVYGIYSVLLARPAYVVFEIDRFRVVTLVDRLEAELPMAPPELRQPSWTGPTFIATTRPSAQDEDYSRTQSLSLQGVDISSRPRYWVAYASKTADVLKVAQSLAELKRKNPARLEAIEVAIKKTSLAEVNLVYVPLQGRSSYAWSVLLDARSAKLVGYVEADGF